MAIQYGNTIPNTTVGTNAGDEPEICDGFALFPKVGTVRAGISYGKTGEYSWKPPGNQPVSFGIYSLLFEGGAELFGGICGPAYATTFDVNGTYDYIPASTDPQGDPTPAYAAAAVQIENGKLTGGLEIGYTADLSGAILVWEKSLSNPETGTLIQSFELEVKIDLIGLLFKLIAALLGPESAFTKFNTITESSILSSWGLVDTDGEPYGPKDNPDPADDNPRGEITPAFHLIVNLVPFTAGVEGLEEIYAIEEGLAEIGGALSIGPVIVVGFPTTVRIPSITLNDHHLEVDVRQDDDSLLCADNDEPGGTPVTRVDRVGATLRHTVTISVGLGFSVIFSLGLGSFEYKFETGTVDMTRLLSVTDVPTFGPYDNEVCSQSGQGPGSDPQCPAPEDSAQVAVGEHGPTVILV